MHENEPSNLQIHLARLCFEVHHFRLQLHQVTRVCSIRVTTPLPLDIVFGLFLNKSNALEDVCNVINAALLHIQLTSSDVEVEDAVWCLLDELHKFFREQAERAVVAAAACCL